jgi:hypothetical protein
VLDLLLEQRMQVMTTLFTAMSRLGDASAAADAKRLRRTWQPTALRAPFPSSFAAACEDCAPPPAGAQGIH